MQEEIFGPVLPVLTYEDLDDVIDRLRKLPKPLALYLFTEDRKTEKKIIENVAFGGGCMNDTVGCICRISVSAESVRAAWGSTMERTVLIPSPIIKV